MIFTFKIRLKLLLDLVTFKKVHLQPNLVDFEPIMFEEFTKKSTKKQIFVAF
jgi:hypothetical protein